MASPGPPKELMEKAKPPTRHSQVPTQPLAIVSLFPQERKRYTIITAADTDASWIIEVQDSRKNAWGLHTVSISLDPLPPPDAHRKEVS